MTVAELDPFIDTDTVAAPTLREVVESAPTLTVVGGPSVRPSLSTREVEVLLAWLAAESKEDAAGTLFISASTVSTHISRIRTKYSAVSRPAPTKAHLLARALQDGYTTLDVW